MTSNQVSYGRLTVLAGVLRGVVAGDRLANDVGARQAPALRQRIQGPLGLRTETDGQSPSGNLGNTYKYYTGGCAG